MSVLAHGLRAAAGNTGDEVEYGFVDYTVFSTDTQFLQSVDIAIPSGAQEGDLLVIAFSADAFWNVTAAGLTPGLTTAGLSLYPNQGITASAVSIFVAYKYIGPSEGSSLSISFGSGLDSDEGGQNLVAHAMLFRDYTLNTNGTLPALVGPLSATTPTYNSTTATNVVDDITLTVAALDDQFGITLTSPSTGYTTIGFDESSTGGGTLNQASTLLTQYKVLTSTATESPGSPTLSGFNEAYKTLTLQLFRNV